ncbi:hypothetical protein [Rhodococcoides fascians]|uniref:hypothetical protein n=1 Tax=Rhodococcoides fascians TaxID=1828 RepID=UPI00050BE7EB|nr:hypothetical protein [Rhodococcus fascians]
MTLPNLLDGTEEFLRAAQHPIPDAPAIPAANVIALRLKLLVEEVTELMQAVGFDDLYDYLECAADEVVADVVEEAREGGDVGLVEMVDAFHDITVIAFGGALETAGSVGARRAADEVTRSNLSKVVAGKVLRRADNKILKPPGFVPPDIAGALGL